MLSMYIYIFIPIDNAIRTRIGLELNVKTGNGREVGRVSIVVVCGKMGPPKLIGRSVE